MKNSVKRILMVVLITASLMSQVSAAEVGYLDGKDGKIDTTIEYSTQSTDYIWYAKSRISDIGDQDLYVKAETECLQSVDTIIMSVELQKKVNGVWSDVREWTVTGTNTDYLDFDVVYTNAQVGASYRVKTTHTAVENGDSEHDYTYTNGVIVQ